MSCSSNLRACRDFGLSKNIAIFVKKKHKKEHAALIRIDMTSKKEQGKEHATFCA